MTIPPEFQPGSHIGTDSHAAPIALVTGGARRIGAAFVRKLASDGFRVAIHYHRSGTQAQALAGELAAAGCPPALTVRADLSSHADAASLLDQLPEAPLLLVNNASLFKEDALDAIDPQLWERHFAINLRAPSLLTAAFARRLPEGRSGLIVNMLDAKLLAPNADFFSYTLSKYGLAALTELSARRLASRIRVNAIAPAVTLASGEQTAADFEAVHRLNALGRGVSPDDLVAALHYLVHTPTVTGQTLAVEAGQRFLSLPRDVAYMAES